MKNNYKSRFISYLLNKSNQMNIWLLLLPFLILYLVLIIIFASNAITGDQLRYYTNALHIVNGTYNKLGIYGALMEGPGYPLIFSIFIFLKLPVFSLRLLNGIFLYLSLVFSYYTIREYTSKNSSLLFAIILGFYYPIYQNILLTESDVLAWFLISVICYLFVKSMRNNRFSWRNILITSFSIFYLVMTRVIFGDVIICMLIVSIGWWFISKNRRIVNKVILIFLLSLIFCIPYLYYTYSRTHELFYWSSAGNECLYTMSTPYSNEYGNWIYLPYLSKYPNHSAFLKKIEKMSFLDRDKALRKKALENIKKYPIKYLENWVANIGRLLFSYPKSYEYQDMNLYYTMVPTMFAVVFISISVILSIFKFRYLPIELTLLLLFIMTYLFGSSLVSAMRRYFYITMPFWIIFISFVFNNLIIIKVKK